MKPEVRTMWIEELMSGKHKQGKGYLHSDEGLCCLGVLCHIAVREGITTRTTLPNDDHYAHDGIRRYGNCGIKALDVDVMQWAGLALCNPALWDDGTGAQPLLSNLNDEGMPFEQIAKLIAQQPYDWNGVRRDDHRYPHYVD